MLLLVCFLLLLARFLLLLVCLSGACLWAGARGSGCLVCPWVGLVFRAPSDSAVGPGCLVCPWVGLLGVPVGGGPPVRLPHASLTAPRSISKPGQAPPPPTAAAARPFGSATAHGRRSQALRFRRRPRPPQPGPVSNPGQAPPAATLNISAYDLRQHFLFYPQCAK